MNQRRSTTVQKIIICHSNSREGYQVYNDLFKGIAKTNQNHYVIDIMVSLEDRLDVKRKEIEDNITADVSMVVCILTEDFFNIQTAIILCDAAFARNIPPALVHSIKTPFPDPKKFPNHLVQKGLLHRVAVPVIKEYSDSAWKRIISKMKVNQDVETDIFLSYKQTTGQSIAMALYLRLKEQKQNVFLDVQCSFDLHDLKQLVSKTKTYVLILTEGIFQSYWCLQEFKAALDCKKKIIFVKDVNYEIPNILPGGWQVYRDNIVLMEHKMISYSPHYLDECIDRVLNTIRPKIFSFSNCNESGIQCLGDAQLRNDELIITPSKKNSCGAVWYKKPIDVTQNLRIIFDCRICELTGRGADGFAFCFQKEGLKAIGKGGAGLGYEDITGCFAIEFDMYSNPEKKDSLNRHVAVHCGGIRACKADKEHCLSTSDLKVNLQDGAIHTVEIELADGRVTVKIDQQRALEASIKDSFFPLFQNRAYVGFTAGTGCDTEAHKITKWEIYQF